MNRFSVFVLVTLICLLSAAQGEEWAVIGARAVGMGGANVAAAKGAGAYYWNPALYSAQTRYDMAIPAGFGLGIEGDMLEKADFIADRISTVDLDNIQDTFNDTPAAATEDMMYDAFELLLIDIPLLSGYGTGVSAYGTAGIETRIGNYGVSAMGLAYAGAHPVINLDISGGVALSDNEMAIILAATGQLADHTGDLTAAGTDMYNYMLTNGLTGNSDIASTFVYLAEQTPPNPNGDTVDLSNPTTQSIFIAIAEATFDNETGGTNEVMVNNLSGVDIGLIATREIAFTYSDRVMQDRLALGVNIKGVIADTFRSSIIASELDDGESITEQATDFYDSNTRATRLAFDVGAAYAVTDTFFAGITVRNINQPVFPYDGDDDGFTLYAQTRAGIAWQATDSLLLAADLDLFPNISEVIIGHKSQFLAAGLEWEPVRWWALRTGINSNIATGDSPTYCLGMGFHISKFYLDLAGSMGFSRIKIESDEIGTDLYVPERLSFMMTMGFSFDF